MNLNKDQIKTALQAINDFSFFVDHIFSLSFDNWVSGEHIHNVAFKLQTNKKTARISARDHFKSTSMYAYLMWRLFQSAGRNEAWDYFSYQESMAGYHISKIKKLISMNPYFADCIDLKITAESVMKYHWKGDDHVFTVDPHGMLAFKRGLHGYGAIVDDPFQDPENKMLLTKIKKINDIFVTQIMDIPSDELHVVGTAQTNEDFFFNPVIMKRFDVSVLPALKTQKVSEEWTDDDVLWPEHMSAEELRHRKAERGDKIFSQEYLCSPVYAEESFFKRDDLLPVINNNLQPLNPSVMQEKKQDVNIIGGWDIGKKAHPSHIAVYEVFKDHWKQIFQIFLDGWDYTDQLEYVTLLIDNLHIDALYYDDTRGELQGFEEQRILPQCMVPVSFSIKTKSAMATEFEKIVKAKQIELLPDVRQLEQILLVTNDLDAIETPQGHGDSFWSNGLCFYHNTLKSNFYFTSI